MNTAHIVGQMTLALVALGTWSGVLYYLVVESKLNPGITLGLGLGLPAVVLATILLGV